MPDHHRRHVRAESPRSLRSGTADPYPPAWPTGPRCRNTTLPRRCCDGLTWLHPYSWLLSTASRGRALCAPAVSRDTNASTNILPRLSVQALQIPRSGPVLGNFAPEPLPRVPVVPARRPHARRPRVSLQITHAARRHRGTNQRRVGDHPPLHLLQSPARQPNRRGRR